LALLDDPAYKKLTKDPTQFAERKYTLLIKASSLPEEVAEQLRPHGPRPPKLYGLHKIQKAEVPLRPIIVTTGAPTYRLAK